MKSSNQKKHGGMRAKTDRFSFGSEIIRIIKRINEISRWHIQRHILKFLLRPDYGGEVDSVKGWLLPAGYPRRSAICYCAGVGENIDFELELINRHGAKVYCFDPTPRAVDFIANHTARYERLSFFPVGVWSENKILRFYAPDNPLHISHSIVTRDTRRNYFEAPCKRLATLMRELGHRRIDLLKMNIEGAEYEVLRSMMDNQIRPQILALTFEGRWALFKAVAWTKQLRRYHYQFAGLDRWAATFIDHREGEG